jgi:hypothetical protein
VLAGRDRFTDRDFIQDAEAFRIELINNLDCLISQRFETERKPVAQNAGLQC